MLGNYFFFLQEGWGATFSCLLFASKRLSIGALLTSTNSSHHASCWGGLDSHSTAESPNTHLASTGRRNEEKGNEQEKRPMIQRIAVSRETKAL